MKKSLYIGFGVISLIAVIYFLSGGPAIAEAAVNGPNTTTSSVNGTALGGTTLWTNPGNMTIEDGSFATFASGVNRRYASTTSYGFVVPDGATIDGIVAEVNRKCSSAGGVNGNCTDNSVRLMKSGVVVGSDKASGSTWSTALTRVTYGSSSDLWGTTWTVAEINETNFGLAFAPNTSPLDGGPPTASVDDVRITVYYSAGSSPASVTSDVIFFE